MGCGHKDMIRLSIHDALTKQAFEYEVRKLNGIADGSFSKNVVTINKDIFPDLLLNLFDNLDTISSLIDSLPKGIKNIESGEGLVE